MTIAPLLLRVDDRAPCRTGDPDRFFPSRGGHEQEAAAAECRTCPFLDACARYALYHAVSGIWGGTTGKERRRARARDGIVPEPVQFGPTKVRQDPRERHEYYRDYDARRRNTA
jgi:hypothetical protein